MSEQNPLVPDELPGDADPFADLPIIEFPEVDSKNSNQQTGSSDGSGGSKGGGSGQGGGQGKGGGGGRGNGPG